MHNEKEQDFAILLCTCPPATQHNADEVDDGSPPSAPEQETNQSPPPPSQGTEQNTAGTRLSAAQVQFDPLAIAIESIEPPNLEQGTVGIEEEIVDQDSNHVLDPDEDIIVDPGLRKPIDEMHPNIRDDAKREYILLGPCQPIGHTYPRRKISGRYRSFHEKWYTNHPWLEYSIKNDAAFCFYCYLFRPFILSMCRRCQ